MAGITLFALNHLWLSAVVFAVVYAGLRSLPQLNVRTRAAVWTAALASMVLLPLITFIPASTHEAGPFLGNPFVSTADFAFTAAATEPNPTGVPVRPLQPSPLNTVGSAAQIGFLSLWVLGTLYTLLCLARRLLVTKAMRHRAQILPPGSSAYPECWPNRLTIAESQDVHTLMLTGLIRPMVLIPSHSAAKAGANLRILLGHERAHYDRGDHWAMHLIELAKAAFWWNPALHVAARQLGTAREEDCDARAALACGEPEQFARALVAFTRQIRANRAEVGLSLNGPANDLEQRVTALLTPPAGMKLSVTAIAVFIGCAMTTGVVMATVSAPRIASSEPRSSRQTSTPFARIAGLSDAERDLTQAMLAAANRGDTGSLARLLALGADPNLAIEGDGTALIVAAHEGHAEAVGMLIKHAAQVDLAVLGDGNPLIIAAAQNQPAIANMLISAGADVNAYVPGDETPLINAARFGNLQIVRLLLNSGANPNQSVIVPDLTGESLRSPMSVATEEGHSEIVALLREYGADAAR